MSHFHIFTLILLISLFNSPISFSADPPELSPSPAPEVGADFPTPTPSNSSSPSSEPSPSPSPSPLPSPSPYPNLNSPPAPPPSDLAPESYPAPAPAPAPAPGTNSTDTKKKSPAAAPAPPNILDVSAGDGNSSTGGMNGGKKAGIAIGVIASMGIVGLGALVCKKRQQNIRRARLGYAARRDFLSDL